MASLDPYQRKRNFSRTSEPAGSVNDVLALADSTKGGKFVIHKHDASRLHYDLRLEQNGVLASWAVPKGPSLIPGEKRLAVKVEDHPLEYGDFEGTIPKEEYGGGTVMLWDRVGEPGKSGAGGRPMAARNQIRRLPNFGRTKRWQGAPYQSKW